jgi:NifU-like protein involved in Fe-S cluster formation
MSQTLYNTRILRLAASIPHQARLASPEASVVKVSPLCGSRITADVRLSDGKVSDFGQEVRACALGQAAASIVGAQVLGRSPEELAQVRDRLRGFLKGQDTSWDGDWSDMDVFTPAIPHKSRHGSILLAIEAAAEAARKAQEASAP